MRALGWAPKLTIEQSIIVTLDWLEANAYAMSERAGLR